MRLAGKGAVVTGGTRGIGRATVDAFLAEGAHVVACGRSELPPDADRLSWVRADVSREDEVEALFDAALDRLPGLDVVVNNAGVAHDTLLVDLTLADWQRVLDVNLRGPFLVCRRAVDEMLASGGGRIVNVSSFAAGGLVGEAAYATAKAALLSLTRSIAKEYGSRRIACNAVVPGYVDTDMLAGLSAAAREARARLSPEARFGRPEEVAEAIVFLASDEAAFVTGDALYVAGAVRDVPRLS